MSDPTYARHAIAAGSKSFAAASRLLPREVRDDVVRLYAWCRHCDDVIDGQTAGHGEEPVDDPAWRLADLKAQTDAALDGTLTGEAVFDGFGDVARRHGIARPLAHDLLNGFAMDVEGRRYETVEELAAYCYGVAGAVGIMMALTLGVPPGEDDTLDRACDLGLAFQMTNIARDVAADARIGRVYLPADLLAREGLQASPEAVTDPANRTAVYRVVLALLDEADRYYRSAEAGIARLPFRRAWAIAAAASVYRAIGARRRAAGPDGLSRRVATGRAEKLRHVARAAVRATASPQPRPRTALWSRPHRALTV